MKTHESYLDLIARKLIHTHGTEFRDAVVVLPNKRAKVFLLDALKRFMKSTAMFSPQIWSVEDLIQDMAQIRTLEPIPLLFEFYDVYKRSSNEEVLQDFDTFSHWGKTLLQDFNEIDRYLLPPDKVFSYLKEAEALKRWDLTLETSTELIEQFLKFWDRIPILYKELTESLLSSNVGYQGLIYRVAVDKLIDYSDINKFKKFYFLGFNALNQAEEKIFQHFLSQGIAEVIWDTDETFLNDPMHDAGYFARRIKSTWSFYKSHEYEYIGSTFQTSKKINIQATPKLIGQVKLVASAISEISTRQNGDLSNTAVILGDETLLIPLLQALPSEVPSLNITMGYDGVHHPVKVFILKLVKMHVQALQRNATNPIFYYKDILQLLHHPMVNILCSAPMLIEYIRKFNYSFIPSSTLMKIAKEEYTHDFQSIFGSWSEMTSIEVLHHLQRLLTKIANTIELKSYEDKITRAFLYAGHKFLNRIINYCEAASVEVSFQMLEKLILQTIDLETVSFEGEPLSGLQIMGVLESRVLDFENVIIVSLNEGVFPAGKTQNSYIPYDIKLDLGLPTYKEKDAIYAYHFYHSIQRASQIWLIYNTESDGLNSGERSRFITQLEIDQYHQHQISETFYQGNVPDALPRAIEIQKSDLLLDRLREMATRGFSPTSFGSYLRDASSFYFEKVLGISNIEEVEESVATNTMGTIVHAALEKLYEPLIDQYLNLEVLSSLIHQSAMIVEDEFHKFFEGGEIDKGRNLLALEVSKSYVRQLIEMDVQAIQKGDSIKILALEKEYRKTLEDPILPYPVTIKGNIDRVELRNDVLRVVDYKTGKVNKTDLVLRDWDDLITDVKHEKKIQLLCYALIIQDTYPQYNIEAGIISFRALSEGFMSFTLKLSKNDSAASIDQDIIASFKCQLLVLIQQILSKDIPFIEKNV